ncbi:MAG: hypothetical protein ACK4YV_04295 [Emticicia sp.]
MQKVINAVWFKIVYVLFLIILLFPYYRLSETPQAGIDNSWRIGLEMAKAKGLIFGKDIIYTYGPLGYLTQRFAIDTPAWHFLVFDIFFFLNIGLLLFFALPKQTKFYQYIIHFALIIVISSLWGEWVIFTLFFVGLFSGLKFLHTPQLWMLYHSIIISIVVFYTKANYGIIALGFVAVLLGYAFFSKRLTLKNLIFSLVFTLTALALSAKILNTDLFAYFYSSIQATNGYTEAMSVYPSDRLKIVLVAYLIFGLLIAASVFYVGKTALKLKTLTISQLDNIFIISCVALISFILIKYSFVRADDGHITAFVKLANLPFLLLPLFCTDKIMKKIGWGLISCNILGYFLLYQPVFGEVSLSVTANLHRKIYIFNEYFKEVTAGKKDYTKPTFPKEVLSTIGNKSVDFIPNEISEIYFNRLNYNPRPAIQSYFVYNAFLLGKNQEKYLSTTAPDFVVYSIESTDNKYAFSEETLTMIALLQRYEPIKMWPNRLLFKKKEQTKTLKLVKQSSTIWEMGKIFPLNSAIKSDSSKQKLLSIIKVKTTYNWFGKLLNLLFQPPHLNMEIATSKGEKTIYRTVPILLNKGLIVNAKIDDVAAVKQFFETGSVENKEIQSVRFDEILRRKAGFDKKIEILEEFYELK